MDLSRDAATSVVEQRVYIAAPPETVWRFWTDPARMCDWWGVEAELDPRPGGTCTVTIGAGAIMRGEYVELVLHERIVLTFGWEATEGAPPVAPGSTRVEVTLAPEDGGTLLILRHTSIPAAQAGQHEAGWSHFLGVLYRAASGAS